MVAQRYRWDFIGLSTDEKPTAETSPKVTDGSTFYCSDNSKLYVWYKNQWYEKTATGGGGGGGAIVELTADDYDYTYGDVPGVALWRLPSGLYHTPDDVQAYSGADKSDYRLSLKSHFIIIDDDGSQKLIKVVGDKFSSAIGGIYKGFVEYSTRANSGYCVPRSETSVVTSASLMIKQAVAPSSGNVGFAGQLWYDTSANKLYVNVNNPSDFAGNWKEIALAS